MNREQRRNEFKNAKKVINISWDDYNKPFRKQKPYVNIKKRALKKLVADKTAYKYAKKMIGL